MNNENNIQPLLSKTEKRIAAAAIAGAVLLALLTLIMVGGF